ncbi:MAG: hypothetical protein DRJ07_12230, partial [Bacteroidetes bacterium]
MESKAVVKHNNGKLQVVKVGDLLPESNARIVQILTDRIVVKHQTLSEKTAQETVWIYKV